MGRPRKTIERLERIERFEPDRRWNPRSSFVIPAKNEEKMIGQCLDAINNRTMTRCAESALLSTTARRTTR